MPNTPPQRIAILVESSRAFGRGLIEGINSFASERDDWLLYYHEGTLHFDLAEWLDAWNGDGVITRITNEKDAHTLAASGIPTVDLLGEIHHPSISVVDSDNAAIAQMAVEFFIRAGFTNLAYCGYPGLRFSDQRFTIFEEAARAEHLSIQHYLPLSVPESSIHEREHWQPHREADISAWLISLPKPIAIFACNDVRALDLSVACRVTGIRVPEDVAILGVDNDELICKMSKPPLSSIEPDTMSQGTLGAETLLALLNTNSSAKEDPHPAQTTQTTQTSQTSQPVHPVHPVQVIERPSTDLIAFSSPIVADALRYLRKHSHEKIGSQQIATAIGTSNSHLNRLFKEATGRTINKELQRIHLTRIRHLLQHSDLTLKEIAQKIGFSSNSNLSKFFKIHEGMTPGEFKGQTFL